MISTSVKTEDNHECVVVVNKKNEDYKTYELDENGKLLSYIFIHKAVKNDD